MLCNRIINVRHLSIQLQNNAKKKVGDVSKPKAGGGGRGKVVKIIAEPDPVRDTTLLTKQCCGANKFIHGADPELQTDENYPDWLWTIHTGKPRELEDLDPNTKEYWYQLRDETRKQKNLAQNGIKFYKPPAKSDLMFNSRITSKRR